MKSRLELAAALLISAVALAQSVPPASQAGSQPAAPARAHYWWHDQAPGAGRPYAADNKKLPLISVKGNQFVDPDGKPVLFRGLSISDPDKLQMQGHWNRDHFVKVRDMGTTLLRIPVHPVAWRERGGGEYVKLLDQAVEWATEPRHVRHHRLALDRQHDDGRLPGPDVRHHQGGDLRLLARHGHGATTAINTVAFFELFNEPAAFGGCPGMSGRRSSRTKSRSSGPTTSR